jgi:translation initiation factor 2B subunit (eIF-2B alpha/beta/delta family)
VNINDCYRILAQRITENACVAFIGAGVSATYVHESQTYKGLPMARDLLETLKAQRSYLQDVNDLSQAVFLMSYYEGRSAVEVFLKKELGDPKQQPLPAHRLLAKLCLDCYVSMNFDGLLEKSLDDDAIRYLSIIEDEDVSLLTGATIPVIKPHGSLDRPKTVCVATDETLNFIERIPVIAHLLTAMVANKTVIFLGFSLSDPDFINLIRYLKKTLGRHMPQNFAVVLNKNDFLDKFWKEHSVTVIESDATKFLTELEANVKTLRFQLQENLEPWMKNSFFWELLEIRSLPTETQVIEALLREIKRRLMKNVDADQLDNEIQTALILVLEHRKNYFALRGLGNELKALFENCRKTGERVWDTFREIELRRSEIGKRINSLATSVIGQAKTIALFSQSQRVVDCLLALDPYLQSSITLIIAECRPKSPNSFQDAIATTRLLRESSYKIRLLPDMALFHYVERKMIDLVLLGAHVVFRAPDGEYKYFVNTCGSGALVTIASEFEVPVKVIFEEDKVIVLDDEEQLKEVSYSEEENIANEVVNILSLESTLSDRTTIVNVGYDLVKWRDNVTAVTGR